MRGSNQRRIKSEITVKVQSDDDEDIGTAARTRPLSFDEIMLRRKNRKVLEYSNNEESELGKISSKEATRYDSGQSAYNDANIKTSDARTSYQRKEEKASKRETENAKTKNKDHHELETKFGQKTEKPLHNKIVEKTGKDVHHRFNEKVEKVVHHRSLESIEKDIFHRSGEKLENDMQHRSGEKLERDVQHRSGEKLEKDVYLRSSEKLEKDVHHRSSEKLEKHMHHRSSTAVEKDAHRQSNEKREKDMSHRASQRTERDASHRSKQNAEKHVGNKSVIVDRDDNRNNVHERLRTNSECDYEKKHHRDHLTSKNRNMDRDAIEREYKRKERNGDDVQHVDKHAVKKHDSGMRLVSERKEKIDSSNSRHEEARLKRRRSKTPEHNKGRGRRTGSFSPRARKFSSSRGDEFHLDKDRSKQQSDADRSKTSNGSGGLYHRHGGSSSGLGGYSPRKRKSDAAVRTPSPLKRSPEKRSAGWDRNPSGTNRTPTSSAPSATQLLVQAKPSSVPSAGVVLANFNTLNSLPSLPSSTKNASIDSVQLTQATRPLRRLYVDNVPSSASEKDIMECFNNFLLSSGANQIQGSKPCISCMIHKEKGQALVEFLTPEDASAALAFDGRSFSGSSLKIRRPKDFVELANDFPERLKAEADAISDIVKDSPHKIFVGGISDTLPSEMLLEIVQTFGPLKAFRIEIDENIREQCAFLEFLDQSVTLKACSALNGMKLGGKVLTVAQAFPDASFVETYGDAPTYEIPQHVKALLEKPTEVLNIKNAVDPLAIKLLSESELEEILDDIRQECTRFGSVKSVNIVKALDAVVPETPETQEATDLSASNQPSEEMTIIEQSLKTELNTGLHVDDRTPLETDYPYNVDEQAGVSIAETDRKPKEKQPNDAVDPTTATEEAVVEQLRNSDSMTEAIKTENEKAEIYHNTPSLDADDAENKVATEDSNVTLGAKTSTETAEFSDNGVPYSVKEGITLVSGDLCKTYDELQEKETPVSNNDPASQVDAKELSDIDEKVNADHIFEPGCIFVEFRRTEASCMAAHCLHGRLFDGRIVTIEYVPYHLYRTRFPK